LTLSPIGRPPVPAIEIRLLQAAIAVGSLSPLLLGLAGMIEGPAMLAGVDRGGSAADLVSHYRFLSGIFFATGLVFLSCLPRIEVHGDRFRMAAALIILGGLARLGGYAMGDTPSLPHRVGLLAELVLVPLLVLWQARVESRRKKGSGADANC
jgi:hypothetical protein